MSYDILTPEKSPETTFSDDKVSLGSPRAQNIPRVKFSPSESIFGQIDDENLPKQSKTNVFDPLAVDTATEMQREGVAPQSLHPAFLFNANASPEGSTGPDSSPKVTTAGVKAERETENKGVVAESEDDSGLIDVTFEKYDASQQPLISDIEAGEQPGDPIRVPYDEDSQIVDLFSLVVELDATNPGQFKKSHVDEAYLRKNKKLMVNQLKQKSQSESFSWPIENISDLPVALNNTISIAAASKYFAPADDFDSPLVANFDAFALLGKPKITYSGNQAVLQWPGKKPLTIKLNKAYRELLKQNEDTKDKEPEETSPELAPTKKKRKTVEQSTTTNDASTSTKPKEDVAAPLSPVDKEKQQAYLAEREANIARNKAELVRLGLEKPNMATENPAVKKPVATRKPRKSRSNNDDDEDEDSVDFEPSDEDTDSEEESDQDDDDDDEKEKKVTRSKKPKEKSEKKAKVEDSFVSLDNISLDARAKKIISDFLNSDNTPTLKFSNLSSAVRSAQQSSTSLAPVAARSSSTTSRPSSAQLAAQNSSSTSRKSVTTISEPQKEKTQNPAKTVDFSNMDERQRNISLCEQRSDVSVQRLAEQLNIPILNSQLQVKSKRQLCAEINAKQEARQQL